MTVRQPLFEYDIDVGGGGISRHYDLMLSYLKDVADEWPYAILIWCWIAAWPLDFVGFPIWRFITVALLIKIRIFYRTLPRITPFWEAGRYWRKWRALEAQGLSFVTRNHHRFRVLFYWRSDGRLQYDGNTRDDRAAQEIGILRSREEQLRVHKLLYLKPLRNLALIVLGFYLLNWFGTPLLRSYLSVNGGNLIPEPISDWFWTNLPWAGYAVLDAQAQIFFGRFGIEELFVANWCVINFLPLLVKHAITLWERHVYLSGAQFIPGAKVFDPVLTAISLETMEAEMVHGNGTFVAPAAAARLMAG